MAQQKVTMCLNLRSKEMFYKDPGDPDQAKETERLYATCDTAMYWCDQTQTGRGPDDQPANREGCSCSTRTCFLGIEGLV